MTRSRNCTEKFLLKVLITQECLINDDHAIVSHKYWFVIPFFFTSHQLILIIFIKHFFISNSVFSPGYSSPGNPDGTYE